MLSSISGTVVQPDRTSAIHGYLDLGFLLYLRAVSLVLVAVAIGIWMRIVGFEGPDLQQIFVKDNLSGFVHFVLAVSIPILSVGLWLNLSWGIILWGMIGIGLVACGYTFDALNSEFVAFGLVLSGSLIFYIIVFIGKNLFLKKPVKEIRVIE